MLSAILVHGGGACTPEVDSCMKRYRTLVPRSQCQVGLSVKSECIRSTKRILRDTMGCTLPCMPGRHCKDMTPCASPQKGALTSVQANP